MTNEFVKIRKETLRKVKEGLGEMLAILRSERAPIQCSECQFWAGSCGKGRVNRTASSEACEIFQPRGGFKHE